MYDFDTVVDRRNTGSLKWDVAENELPMWVADMDFQVAPEILDAARECCEKGVFGYTFRSDKAKQAFADWVARRHGWQVDTRWLLSSPGIVTALALGVRVYTEEHDKVMIFTPVYPPFYAVVKDNNRELVCSTLNVENGHYQINWEDVEKKLKNGVKLLIISNSTQWEEYGPRKNLLESERYACNTGSQSSLTKSIPTLPSSDTSTW